MLTRPSHLNTNNVLCSTVYQSNINQNNSQQFNYTNNNANVSTGLTNVVYNPIPSSTFQPYYSLFEINLNTIDTINNIISFEEFSTPIFLFCAIGVFFKRGT